MSLDRHFRGVGLLRHAARIAIIARVLAFAALLACAAPAVAQQSGYASAVTPPVLNADLLSGYVASKRYATLRQDVTFQPASWSPSIAPRDNGSVASGAALTPESLGAWARRKFEPTAKRVNAARQERLCLAQAIYHEARGESETGQWAVANVVLNRVGSRRYPATICGVVFQNANGERHRCQFSFACDGRSDMGGNGNRIVRESWIRANMIAYAAFKRYQAGEKLETLPASALYYHTNQVSPDWSASFRPVAAIGSHIFYAPS